MDPSILTAEAVLPATSIADRPADRGNLRAASALLDEAGWIMGDDGVRRKNGQELTLEFLMVSPAFDRIVNPYIENLERLGVKATLDRVDYAQYIDRRRTGDYDMVNHTMTQGFEPGVSMRQWFDSSTAADSSRNLMGLADPAVDQLMTHIIDAQSFEEMITGTHALDRTLRAIGFWVPQWYKDVHTVAYYDFYGYPDNLPPFGLGDLSLWWYDAERAEVLRAAGAFQQ